MRTISVFMNISLDGYVEAPGNDISGFTGGSEAFSPGSGGAVDALLFGRKTYESMKFWSTPEGRQLQPDVARFMTERQKYVASHSAFDPGWQNVTVLSQDVPGAVQRIKNQPGGAIMIFGSNTLCVSLMQTGLIDTFQIMVNPVVFGAGTSLFAGLPAKMPLQLIDERRFPSGAVLLTYTP